jgi:hypothetical protein
VTSTGRTGSLRVAASARIIAGIASPAAGHQPLQRRLREVPGRGRHADGGEGDQRRRAVLRREVLGAGLAQRAVEIEAVQRFRRLLREVGMRHQPSQHRAVGLAGQGQVPVLVVVAPEGALGPVVQRAIGRAGVEGQQLAHAARAR